MVPFPVTLSDPKSRLRVTQDHWKRNHWIIHDLLSFELFYVEYYCDLEMWVRGHFRLFKMVPFESLNSVSCSPSIVTIAVLLAISDIFSVEEWPYHAVVQGH